ncbi:MAG TPA: amidohydrolase family protein [Microlunatus sp.]
MMRIREVRPWGGDLSDVLVDDGSVVAVAPAGAEADPIGETIVEGRGRLLLPAFSDAHVHLDSTRLGLPFRPFTGGKTVLEQMRNDRRHWRTAGASVAERATHTLGMAIANGATRARSYAQIDSDCGLERLFGVVAARDTHSARAEVEIIAFPQAGVIREPGALDLLDAALQEGADTVGGLDPCAVDRDPRAQLDVVFELAQRHGAGVDVHLHEPGDLGRFSMELVIDRTRALGYQGRVTVSHAFALADGTAESERILDQFAELDIALTTIAPGSRAALPLRSVVQRGIRIGLGQDGQRDYWSPYGNADMLDRTWQLAWSNGFRADADIECCLAVATTGGAAVMNPALGSVTFAPVGDRPIRPADVADFVLLTGETPTAAVMDRLSDRTVIHAGRVVADEGILLP